MIARAIETLKQESERLSETISEVVATIPTLESSSGSPLEINMDADLPDTIGSMKKCNDRIQTLLGLITEITKLEKPDFSLVPKSLIIALPKSISSIDEQLDAMLVDIDRVKGDGGLRNADDNFIIYSVSQKEHPNINLKPFYSRADNQVNQTLKVVHEILSILKPKSYDPFSGAITGINALEENLQTIQKEVVGIRKDVKTTFTQIETQASSATTKLAELEALCQEALTLTKRIGEDTRSHAYQAAQGKEQTVDLLTDIKEIDERATDLKEQAEILQLIFKEFQKNLNERNSIFENGKNEFETLRKEMIAASEKNNNYIEEPKNALG